MSAETSTVTAQDLVDWMNEALEEARADLENPNLSLADMTLEILSNSDYSWSVLSVYSNTVSWEPPDQLKNEGAVPAICIDIANEDEA